MLWMAVVAAVLCASAQTPEQIARFLDWSNANGMEKDAVVWPTEFESTGRGVSAVESILPGDVFLSVPLKLCLANETYRNTPMQPITEHLGMLRGVVYVLLREQSLGNASFWKPYIDTLPPKFDTLNHWNLKELRELQDDGYFLPRLRLERKWDYIEYTELRELLRVHGLPRWFTFSQYRWASSVVATRCFDLNTTLAHTLVPFADLFNHHQASGTRWGLSTKQSAVLMYSYQLIPSGYQVYNNYGGDMSNFRSLSNYGFVLANNEHNSEKLRVRGKYVGRMFAKIRVMQTMQMFKVLANNNKEQSIFATCVQVLDKELKAKPTSIDEDANLLLQASLSFRFKLAVMYRMERKRLLDSHREFCSRALELIDCLAPPQRETLFMTNLARYLKLIKLVTR